MTDVKDRPEASSDAELILKLQDKLDSLKNQVHTWTAKAKGKPREFLVSFLNCMGLYKNQFIIDIYLTFQSAPDDVRIFKLWVIFSRIKVHVF